MSLSCWSHRLDRTRHTSVCGFSYSLSNLFSFKTTLLTSKYIYGCCNDLSLMLHPIFLTYAFVFQRSVRRRCRLLLVAFLSLLHLPCTLWSFKLFTLLSKSSFFALRSCCCNIIRFAPFLSSIIIWAFVLLVIDAYYVPSPHALLLAHSLQTITSCFARLVLFHFPLSACC